MRYLILLAFVGLFSCSSKKQEQSNEDASSISLTVEVTNPLAQERTGVMVFIDKKDLGNDFNPKSFVVKDGAVEIPSQYNKKDKEGIVFVIDDLGANAEKIYTISYDKEGEKVHDYKKRTQAEISIKKGGEFVNREYIGGQFENIDSLRVPDEHTDHSWFIRYEGPGWESDLVGYRLYLDWRNATDIFAKTTDEVVLQKVGQDGFDSYHEMQDWGMDVLKVGKSLGIGSLSTFYDGKAIRVDKTDSVYSKILENGVVYSSVQNDYYGWNVAETKVNVLSKLSIHAGTRLSHYEVVLEEGELDNLSTGMGKDKKAKLYTSEGGNGKWGYIATYGDQSLNDDNLGLAVLFSNESFMEFTEDDHSHVVKLKPNAGKVDYYFLGAWELEPNGITNEDDFMDYLNQVAEELANPVKVSVK